jgi:hypothetical protein
LNFQFLKKTCSSCSSLHLLYMGTLKRPKLWQSRFRHRLINCVYWYHCLTSNTNVTKWCWNVCWRAKPKNSEGCLKGEAVTKSTSKLSQIILTRELSHGIMCYMLSQESPASINFASDC